MIHPTLLIRHEPYLRRAAADVDRRHDLTIQLAGSDG